MDHVSFAGRDGKFFRGSFFDRQSGGSLMTKFGYCLIGAALFFSMIMAGGDWPGNKFGIASAAEKAMKSKANYFDKKKEEFKKKLQATLADLEKKLDQVKESVDQKTKDFRKEVKENWRETKDSLNEQSKAVKKKLQDLDKVREGSWEKFKKSVDSTVTKLKDTYEKAVSKFK
jgi:ElaB/YqjD/DUF883 family membrane-anchored ribosome-binding protein